MFALCVPIFKEPTIRRVVDFLASSVGNQAMQRLQLGELSVAEDFDTCPAFIIHSPKDPRWYMAYVTYGVYLGLGGVPSKIPGPTYTLYSYKDPLESAVSSRLNLGFVISVPKLFKMRHGQLV